MTKKKNKTMHLEKREGISQLLVLLALGLFTPAAYKDAKEGIKKLIEGEPDPDTLKCGAINCTGSGYILGRDGVGLPNRPHTDRPPVNKDVPVEK